jgi:hypothetical protein
MNNKKDTLLYPFYYSWILADLHVLLSSNIPLQHNDGHRKYHNGQKSHQLNGKTGVGHQVCYCECRITAEDSGE